MESVCRRSGIGILSFTAVVKGGVCVCVSSVYVCNAF